MKAAASSRGRPEFLLDPRQRDELVKQLGALLNGVEQPGAIFSRGGVPAVLRLAESDAAPRQGMTVRRGTAVTEPAVVEHILHALDGLAFFITPTRSGPKHVETPERLARLVLRNTVLRPLRLIARVPVLRTDGSLFAGRGYDAETGAYCWPNIEVPAPPAAPSQEDAREAVDRLLRPYRGYAFAEACGAAVIAALVMTLLTRHLYPTAPGWVLTACEFGSGKTMAAEVAGIIATGVRPAISSGMILEDEVELRKQITTALLANTPLLVFDNAPRGYRLNSHELNRYTTSATYSDRILGVSREMRAATTTVPVVTGNALEVAGDATRRFLRLVIDPGVALPHLRRFDFDPLEEAMEDRAELLAAALTVVRAYLLAGAPEPPDLAPLGSFGGWCRYVRQPLVWCGLGDPVASLPNGEAEDPERLTLGRLLLALRRVFGDASFRAADIVDRARGDADLREPLLEVGLNELGQLEPRRIGRYLERNRGRVVDGLKLQNEYDSHAKANRYRVCSLREMRL